jgi:hypothetical protein
LAGFAYYELALHASQAYRKTHFLHVILRFSADDVGDDSTLMTERHTGFFKGIIAKARPFSYLCTSGDPAQLTHRLNILEKVRKQLEQEDTCLIVFCWGIAGTPEEKWKVPRFIMVLHVSEEARTLAFARSIGANRYLMLQQAIGQTVM